MQAVACLADPKRPGIYALQYLAGAVGCSVFRDIVSAFNLRGELAPAKSPILHLPLLRLMAFSAVRPSILPVRSSRNAHGTGIKAREHWSLLT